MNMVTHQVIGMEKTTARSGVTNLASGRLYMCYHGGALSEKSVKQMSDQFKDTFVIFRVYRGIKKTANCKELKFVHCYYLLCFSLDYRHSIAQALSQNCHTEKRKSYRIISSSLRQKTAPQAGCGADGRKMKSMLSIAQHLCQLFLARSGRYHIM